MGVFFWLFVVFLVISCILGSTVVTLRYIMALRWEDQVKPDEPEEQRDSMQLQLLKMLINERTREPELEEYDATG